MSLIRHLCAGALALAATATTARADRWAQQKGDCEDAMRSWRTQSVDHLRDCMMNWEMYRDVTKVDEDQRNIAREAFEKVYQEGSERDAVMALSALKRLGLKPRRLREEKVAQPRVPDRVEAPVVETVADAPLAPEPDVAPPPTAAAARAPDRRSAKNSYNRGRQYMAAGQFPEALSEFLIAADSDPTFAPPMYMAARCYMKLNKPRAAVRALQQMKAINSDNARQLVRRASQDDSFGPVRNMPEFKDLTGTAVVQILNGAGNQGLDKVMSFAKRLKDAGQPVAAVANDRNPRTSTYVYTKPGYEQQGEIIRRQLQLGMVHKRTIDWPSEYDVILAYGEPKKDEVWVDDEAEKAGKAAADKKKAEEAAKKKAAEEGLARR